MKQNPIEGIEGLRRVNELTPPVGDSREIWLKLGQKQFVVINYTSNEHFPTKETWGSARNRARSRLYRDCGKYVDKWGINNDGGVFLIPTQLKGYSLPEAAGNLSRNIQDQLKGGAA